MYSRRQWGDRPTRREFASRRSSPTRSAQDRDHPDEDVDEVEDQGDRLAGRIEALAGDPGLAGMRELAKLAEARCRAAHNLLTVVKRPTTEECQAAVQREGLCDRERAELRESIR